MSGDVRGLFAELGVRIPERRGAKNVSVSCFANPAAHKHRDEKPACSINVESGLWKCHVCAEKGNAYEAALLLGKTPAEAMALLERHGLRERRTTGRRTKPRQPAPTPAPSLPDDRELERFRTALRSDEGLLASLVALRGWTREAIEQLGLGHDGQRVVFTTHDAQGGVVGVLRYEPDPEKRGKTPKTIADAGSQRELFPAPETVDEGEGFLWLVEGEPDAVAGCSLGLPCVAIPGTGNWQPEWAERFRDRRIVVCLDADAAGRDAAARVVEDLVGIASEARVIDIADIRNQATTAEGPETTAESPETEAVNDVDN